jgi:hypothetical protein
MDTIIRGDWSTWDSFNFRVSKIESWCRGFIASKIDEEENQGITEA